MTEPDGICPSPSCVQAAVLGKRYDLIAGFLDAPEVVIPLWAEALHHARAETGGADLGRPLRLLLAAAKISDRVSCVADLGAHPWPDHHRRREITVPSPADHLRLVRAVTFSKRERGDLGPVVDALLVRDGFSERVRPLMPWRGGFIVARPAQLLLTALVLANRMIAESPALADVLAALGSGCQAVIAASGRDMGWEILFSDDVATRFRVDRDYVADVHVCILNPSDSEVDAIEDARPKLNQVLARNSEPASVDAPNRALVCVVGSGRPWAYEQPPLDRVSHQVSVMRVTDFRLLGDAFRRDPLGLVRVLEQVPAPPWPQGHSVIDMVGLIRAFEDLKPGDDDTFDGVEYLHRRAREMAGRHPAPAPDGDGWIDVSRWADSPDRSLFMAEADIGRFALLVRAPGAFLWVVADDPAATPRHVLGAVCCTLAFWLARLVELGWGVLDATEYAVRFAVAYDRDQSVPLHIEPGAVGGPRLHFGRRFVELAYRGDNSADRLLIETVLKSWGGLTTTGIARLTDAVAPAGRGTFLMWPDVDRDISDDRLVPPEPVTERDLREVARAVIDLLPGSRGDAIVTESAAADGLEAMLDAVAHVIDRLLAPLNPETLVDLMRIYERAANQAELENVTLPARAALIGSERYLGEFEAKAERAPALRGLIERVAARPPTGTAPLSQRTELRLRAAAEQLLRFGIAREALMTGMASCRIGLSRTFGIAVAMEGAIRTGTETAAQQFTEAAPELMAAHHAEWWAPEPIRRETLDLSATAEVGEPRWVAVNEAMHNQWGFSYEQAARLLRAASDLAGQHPDSVAILPTADLNDHLRHRTGIDEAAVGRFLGRFTLTACSDYNPRSKRDRIWETNRSRSYLSSPLVALDRDRVAVPHEHIRTSSRFLHYLIESGRLRSRGELLTAVRALSRDLDLQFELELARQCRERGLRAATRLKRMGGRKIEEIRGQPLGDIDVLAWSIERKAVFVLDSKRITPGIPPLVIRRQGRELIQAAARHARRLRWVRDHPGHLSREINSPVDDEWNIDGALVLERALPGAELGSLQVPAWPIWELAQRLENRGSSS
jgi:hypothetical protein